MISPALRSSLSDPTLVLADAFVGGAWTEARSGARFAVRDPGNGDHLADVSDLGALDASAAIDAAEAAMPAWRARTAKDRGDTLLRFHDQLLAHQEDLAKILTLEMGKPLAEARGEIAYSASFLKWFAGEAVRAYGAVIPGPTGDKRLISIKQGIGLVAAITPWNFPSAMIARKVAPALAAGCAIIVKPAEQTPLSALALAECARRAGVPDGVLNVIPGTDAAGIGEVLCADSRIRKLSFTGSTEVGRILFRQSAPTIKKLSLELGGNAPFIVFDDADLDKAVEGLIASKFRASGQTCVCANRVYVQDGIYDAFAGRLAEQVRKLRPGHGLDAGVTQGPLIDRAAREKVARHVADALGRGAQRLAGGDGALPGELFFPPTVLVDVPADALIAREETFGPVAGLIRFSHEGEVLALANDSEFGLAAYFYTRDINRIWRVFEALETGMVGINTGVISSEVAPFGGVKQSGLGREGSLYGLDDYLEIKTGCFGVTESA
jgi:succinate-semialdehyde dehydrogenase/glutarate-semialdehyde dehydrogenase